MLSRVDKLLESGCEREKEHKICRSRGGESCAFDGAMIVLQPIAEAVHIVHGPISCCGNSWEGRGVLSTKGYFHKMGFTTDMNELDIIYGSEGRLYEAILKTYEHLTPKAIFVYATCVSGLIGEDIEAVCKKAESRIACRVIPVNAPGFVGPKNLGNRIAGNVLLDYVIGTGHIENLPEKKACINLIGEYNVAGDLWLVEPILKEAGIKILSRITGDCTFEEITYSHRAALNVVVCSRALINVAVEMERRYGIPYIEVSFFGKSEMSNALRQITSRLELKNRTEEIINREEIRLNDKLQKYADLKGKRAVLYTGGVKSWSFISALLDLGIEIVAVGTKKSTFEDELKMKEILGENAPLIEDVTPNNLSKIMKEKKADALIAGGRNQYLAVKEGYPFVDVNQERHKAYAGYEGLINLAEEISNAIRFYSSSKAVFQGAQVERHPKTKSRKEILINPLKHSQSIGAAIALQGIDRALPLIHGAQGCTFLAKVLLTKHFREPIALASSKLFTEDVVMGSDEKLIDTIESIIKKNKPDLIGILTSGLSEVKGDDIKRAIKSIESEVMGQNKGYSILHIPTPDYEGGLETGYAKAVEAVIDSIVAEKDSTLSYSGFSEILLKRGSQQLTMTDTLQVNVLAGSHLTPTDFIELREIIESFGLKPIFLPDLSALDGSTEKFSPLALGGTTVATIKNMSSSGLTFVIGLSMEQPAKILKDRFGIEYIVFESIAGLKNTDLFMKTLSLISNRRIPPKFDRQRKVLIDGMRDAHFYYSRKKVCLALEPDLSLQTAHWLREMGAEVFELDILSNDLFSIKGESQLMISNSHAEDTAKRLGMSLYQMGFPVYKILGNTHRVTIGYRGTLGLINDIANVLGDSK